MADGTSPAGFLLDTLGRVLLARCIGVAAELRVADQLAASPLDPATLAARCSADPAHLSRLLRLLASHGIFHEDEQGRFGLTPSADLLRADRPGSLHCLFAASWLDLAWDTYRELPAAVRSGEVAFERAHGQAFFDYLARHPDAGAAFDAAMALVAAAENPVIAQAYDFGRFARVMDLGGGRGGLLAAILARYPTVHGVLADRPEVLRDPADLRAAGLENRCDLVAVDFFNDVPAGADLYVLKRIVHDWPDADACKILARCRAALRPGARLVIIDAILEAGNGPDPNKATDVSLLALTRGRERRGDEFDGLLAAAGLRCTRRLRLPPPATLSLIEAQAN